MMRPMSHLHLVTLISVKLLHLYVRDTFCAVVGLTDSLWSFHGIPALLAQFTKTT